MNLLDNNRTEDLKRAVKDEAYRKKTPGRAEFTRLIAFSQKLSIAVDDMINDMQKISKTHR